MATSKLTGSVIWVLTMVLKAFCADAAAVLVAPARSLKAPTATLTFSVPLVLAVGMTTKVACVPLTRVKAPLVPPVTTTSSVVKLVPTSLLKAKVKVTLPLAVGATMSLVTVRVGGRVSKACDAVVATVTLLPTRSAKVLAAMLTPMLPAELAAGVTTKVYCKALSLVKAPLLPFVTEMMSVVKLVPTSSLSVKVKVTAPPAPEALVTLTVGGMDSAGGVASPPPQAATSRAVARAMAVIWRRCMDGVMVSGPGY